VRLQILFSLIVLDYLLLTPPAEAGPAARVSVPTLCATADAVIIGPVEATTVNGTVHATIVAERVLKGEIIPASSVSLIWTLPNRGMQSPPRALYQSKGNGVFFLQGNKNKWSLLPVTRGDVGWENTYILIPQNLPTSLRNSFLTMLPHGSSVVENVAVELLAAMEAGAPMSADLIDTFRGTRSPLLAAAFGRMLSSDDPRKIFLGLRGSILAGDSAVTSIIRQKHSVLSAATGWNGVLEDLKTLYINTSPQVIQDLGQVAVEESVSIDFRIASAAALARMHTQQTLPYLAKLLGHKNMTLKAMAVGGLSSFANNVPMGSHEPAAGPWKHRTDETIAHSAFDVRLVEQREAYYVGFWTTWWQQNQTALAP
jgi:hypothetical protein